ncbi:precorrin-6y C5,15-methyltransferase (decarboxylating) subunit CbiE [Curvivirga aplysinae]|uniref:precorrin-6y C5,15-methyltransferase (decarboxylating) subunit CbiE n=1 Tax=Curvivirga aplysinae TaxID=2529852 RepID=UPI0012BCE8CF|nr:precorrin-6y C5,15-methyltransferase (decarboxylating) subunit CbiE [Curvivirga aplysinae]MTI10894.1 precorrin-6y C5,15-methyltransferase (decarboxylating) subunit CbiE [Curvivirga aplysinae]
MSQRWIKVIGIGEDGMNGLSASSRILIDQADVVIGGDRHLTMIGATNADQMTWRSPLKDTLADIEKLKGKQVVVLATGDPMSYGIGVTLGKHFGYDQLDIVPAVGAFALASAKMGWALTDPFTECLTLHGRPLENLSLHLRNGVKLIALSANGETPAQAAELLCLKGFSESQITVLSHMGGRDEARISNIAKEWSDEKTADLNVICIECVADDQAASLSRIAGLPDDAFSHDGKMTKREVRAATLALLAPKPGELLWDVGAGCGSIAIEWMRADGKAIAIEDNDKRLGLMADNALSLGTPTLKIIQGRAPERLDGLATPDAIFIGGGLTSEGLVEACWDALPKGGRLVANAVTLQGETKLMEMWENWGGEMSRQSVSRLTKVGPHHGWKPFMQVTQYAVTKS